MSSESEIKPTETQHDDTVTPPPSRTTSDASDASDGSDILNEYQVTSAPSDSDEEVQKILESDVFQWKELGPIPSIIQEERGPAGCDSPNDQDDEIPPLISDSEEDQEDQEEDQEDQEVSDAESGTYDLPPGYYNQPYLQQPSVPPLIYLLGLFLFVLHLIHFATLLKDQQERARNPCFAFKY